MEFVGIDVGAKDLTVARSRGHGRGCAVERYPNEPAGHHRLAQDLAAGAVRARVCLEATGVYGLDLAMLLRETPNLEIMVANPRAVRNFAKALMTRSKTDPVDAEVQAAFAERMPFRPWTPPSPATRQLRDISRHMTGLVQDAANQKNRLHAAKATRTTAKAVLECLAQHIAQIEAHIATLQAAARELVAGQRELERCFRLLISAPGIAERSAIQLLGELASLAADMTKRQWVASAGLDVREETSGTSVQRRPRISKQGNRRLRKALYMPALTAAQRDPNIKAFYDKLQSKGLTKLQALVAVMRKMLHAIHGMFQTNTPFDSAKLFNHA